MDVPCLRRRPTARSRVSITSFSSASVAAKSADSLLRISSAAFMSASSAEMLA
eukprot:CAMPEP_0170646164 /NCGR_PEP_ID=MMETSP0224-20130122/43483_1 /TAXON_ID=285029 /ORGANISM="Togula jolla, Strain CCCM 725" /LENGTH=52 /DNA_ID=CAMNT_0010977461 /DNA_START=76 /DNA_END=230 /DNA_ORIENTATION=+